jgi:hypothetical protein
MTVLGQALVVAVRPSASRIARTTEKEEIDKWQERYGN